VFSNDYFIMSIGRVVFVAGSNKVTSDGRISSSIVTANVGRCGVEPIGRVVVPRSCTNGSVWYISCIWRPRGGGISGRGWNVFAEMGSTLWWVWLVWWWNV
jgi:hypothetical protein